MQFFNIIKLAVLWAFKAIYDLVLALVSPLFNKLANVVPGFQFDTTWADSSWVAFVDLWFPIDDAVFCFGIYLIAVASIATVNWILGLVPANVS